ncbi:uncharacterized protein BDR25DRAFT_396436 [Lindgomyces ingoldianus]|uniref:Uncharacterized protein n=1 Tax=Lindgomyces ingoldianus TaxID=673940 RepID=A0ACB6QFZ2_9PLEO|nr:uncharacterized protein BDR25DRAFT_396436 [Lindgomyces ingoldianus]KAF2465037.1 hypothetical protein BDR25DRAFT_396436 [Lindgomyces ingoldianus]
MRRACDCDLPTPKDYYSGSAAGLPRKRANERHVEPPTHRFAGTPQDVIRLLRASAHALSPSSTLLNGALRGPSVRDMSLAVQKQRVGDNDPWRARLAKYGDPARRPRLPEPSNRKCFALAPKTNPVSSSFPSKRPITLHHHAYLSHPPSRVLHHDRGSWTGRQTAPVVCTQQAHQHALLACPCKLIRTRRAAQRRTEPHHHRNLVTAIRCGADCTLRFGTSFVNHLLSLFFCPCLFVAVLLSTANAALSIIGAAGPVPAARDACRPTAHLKCCHVEREHTARKHAVLYRAPLPATELLPARVSCALRQFISPSAPVAQALQPRIECHRQTASVTPATAQQPQ